MIDFRYHVVSIIAVFLALAVGIVLGSTALQEPLARNLDSQVSSLTQDKDALRTQIADLQARTGYDDAALTRLAPSLVGGTLAGRRVVLVTLPGAPGGVVSGLVRALDQAGATVSGTVDVKGAFTDPKQADVLDALVTSLAEPEVGTALSAAGASRASRAATVLADAVVGKDGTGASYSPGTTALQGFAEGGFVSVSGSPAQRAGLAVVVAPAAPGQATDQTAAAGQAYASLVGQLDTRGEGAVAAGPRDSDAAGGVVAVVDGASGGASTVNSADTVLGQLTVDLALAEQLQGSSGWYGYGRGAAAPVPTPTP